MSIVAPVPGPPGVRTIRSAKQRVVFKGGSLPDDIEQGRFICGACSRDPGNTADGYNPNVLRAGVLMGKITTPVGPGVAGQYAPSIIGVTTVANAAGDTGITTSVAVISEVMRRIGLTGSLNLVGPPAANGVVATQLVTYTALNLVTGVITCPALAKASIIGSLICPTDGSQNPITLIPDGYGIVVTDADSGGNVAAQFPQIPAFGHIDTNGVVNYPNDASLQAWIKARLNSLDGGQFTFSDRT